jgi:outer membrane biosynthesis protein TonB
MVNLRRHSLRAVAFASFVTLLCASGAAAQEANTIGPPQLKDFQLPGQRTTPPADPAPTTAPAPAPARTAAKPAPKPAPKPVATAPRATASAPAVTRPAAAAAAPAAKPAPARAAPTSAAAPTAAPVAPPAETLPPPAAARAAPPVVPAAPAPAAQAASSSGIGWWWLALPLLLLLAGAFLFRRGRRPATRRRDEDRAALGGALFDPAPGPRPAAAPEPASAPVPEPEPQPAPEPVEAPRAWLELDIVPERAAATDNETIVNYELVLRNSGAATAGNIRIDARMFNAGADGEIADFFAGPIHAHSGSPQVIIPPGEELRLGSAIGMAKAQVRTIEVQGRSIFVPVIATTVAYDWTGGTGRSSKSWLVGREAETPAARMGAFRLDLGPRIYRQVGRREGKLEMV